jgi:hypothetical protein
MEGCCLGGRGARRSIGLLIVSSISSLLSKLLILKRFRSELTNLSSFRSLSERNKIGYNRIIVSGKR